jgi:hypothetical protein
MLVSAALFAMLAAGPTNEATIQKASVARSVYVCDASEATRVAWERQYGEMVFVSAKEAMKKGNAWATPRCMSEREHRKLMEMRAKAAAPSTYAQR